MDGTPPRMPSSSTKTSISVYNQLRNENNHMNFTSATTAISNGDESTKVYGSPTKSVSIGDVIVEMSSDMRGKDSNAGIIIYARNKF